MFFRVKQSGPRQYLQIVENSRHDGRVRQRVLTTLGRLDELRQAGHLDGLLASGARFAEHVLLVTAHRSGQVPAITCRRLGPTLIFERLWRETGCQHVLAELLARRHFDFPVERAVFLTVLHRLCATGSDRAAQRWKEDYLIDGADEVALHQLYRTMAWLGDQLPSNQQQGFTKLVPRCTKDVIEEQLFARRSDLFSELDIVFFDTTSLYFEGEGGETLGQYGHSKDHRPDLHQLVVGAVLDGEGRPICCELWPGNTADVTTLIPVVDRLRQRFRIRKACIVADRGMICQETLEELEGTRRPYILGARMRKHKEVREQVLADKGRFRLVHDLREKSTDPAPLKVKEVWVHDRRYVVCVNVEQVEHDRRQRAEIVTALKEQLRQGDKSLVGNKGYRRYLKVEGDRHFAIDEAKLEEEARYDGSAVANRSWTHGRFSIAAMKPFADTCSVRFWRWYCGRNCRRGCKRAATISNGRMSCATWSVCNTWKWPKAASTTCCAANCRVRRATFSKAPASPCRRPCKKWIDSADLCPVYGRVCGATPGLRNHKLLIRQ